MKSLIRLIHIAIFTSALLLAGQCFAESVVTTIPSATPEGVDVDILRQLVYVANFNAPTVSIISEETNTIVDTITFPPGPLGQAEMNGVAVNPVTSRLYATDTRNTVLYVIDTESNQIIDTIPGLSGLMAVNPRTNKLYISLFNNGVVVFDGNTNTRIATVNVAFPQRPAINIANRVYVPSQGFHGSVAVIDGTTNTLLATIPTGDFTTGAGVDFLRNLAYASNQGFSPSTTNLSVIDTVSNTVVATIPTDTNPAPVA
ncbi:MAG TPA: YncE family protein, partial [Candidatus Angelobacter sp.]